MTVDEAEAKLKSKSSQEVRNGWTALDTQGDETYGLNISKVQEVAREINTDPALADELYSGSNHDLKVLATLIDDPGCYTRDDLAKRSEQLYPSPFAENFCQKVMAKSQHAVHFIDQWSHCENDDFNCFAYYTLAEVAKNKNNLSDDFYARHLQEIAERIHSEPDIVKEAMYNALMAIGSRDAKLKKESFKVASKIGEVHFEDGKAVVPINQLEKKLGTKKTLIAAPVGHH